MRNGNFMWGYRPRRRTIGIDSNVACELPQNEQKLATLSRIVEFPVPLVLRCCNYSNASQEGL